MFTKKRNVHIPNQDVLLDGFNIKRFFYVRTKKLDTDTVPDIKNQINLLGSESRLVFVAELLRGERVQNNIFCWFKAQVFSIENIFLDSVKPTEL